MTGLAVILGPVSGGLYCRDFDEAQSYDRWANAYPDYADTLPTANASRGPHVYFTCTDALQTTKYPDGELRGTGSYIVLPPSIHNSGHVYTWTTLAPPTQQPPQVDPEASGLCRPYTDSIVQRVQRRQRLQRITESTEVVVEGTCAQKKELDVAEIVSEALPDRIHENNYKLFHLARGVKKLEKNQQREFSNPELMDIFTQWYDQAQPFLRSGQSFDEYFFEFKRGLEKVKYPLGEEAITHAWDKALNSEPPEIARLFRTEETKILVSLCRELQRIAGQDPFYLSSRTVAALFAHDTHSTAAHWLRGLVSTKILDIVIQGGPDTFRATRYRYLGD